MNSDRIALIIERDPDGENYLTLAIDGQRVRFDDLGEHFDLYQLDAGRGWEGADWFEGVEGLVSDALVKHGRDFASALLDAYRNPPGRQYIDDFDAARARFDQRTPYLAGMRED